MAKTRYGTDHGLNFRMFFVGLLLVLLYAIVVGILFAINVPIVLAVVIALAILGVQYFASAKIALFSMHARVVTPEDAPQLHGLVDRLCALADMPKPEVAIADTDIPNAFATGRSPKHAVVCVTTGILRRLDEPEMEAVLSHELSHIAHRDVAVMTVASFLGMVAGLLTRLAFYADIFGGDENGNTAAIEMAVMLVSAIIYAISFLLIRALSRYRELLADRSGAILIGRPSLLKSALLKITGSMAQIPTKDIRAASHFNAFFFAPAFSKDSFDLSNLFSTHPPIEKRIAALDALEAKMQGH